MFLKYLKTNKYICDLQLIYDIDCLIHFDFYTQGLLNEHIVLNCVEGFKAIDYGVVEISANGYHELNSKMKLLIANKIELLAFTDNIIASIYKLIELNNQVKNSLDNKALFYQLYEQLGIVMSYRRIVDLASDTLMDCNIVKELHCPSYLVMLSEAFNKLHPESSDEALDLFIKEYGYLYTFHIKETPYENKGYLKEMIRENKVNDGKVELVPINFDERNYHKTEEKILYRLSWYSEMRHIYQLRSLRNFRLYLQYLNKDIYLTTKKELFA